MRTMHVALVTAVLLSSAIAAPLAAQGQGGGRAGGDPAAMQARQNERLFEGITLTAEQKTKVDSIQTAARAAQQAAMRDGGMRDPDARERMMTQRRATLASIRALLTAEQQAAFDRNVANMPGMSGGGRPPRG